jgi:ubiquinone/menaquinone biosynthesis C-methylase UbiE
MASEITQEIAKLYTRRHAHRQGVFGASPYANVGYWHRAGMTIEEACDALTELVAAAAQLGAGDRVLEVGCGYGASAVGYTRRYQPASVIGIDVTQVRIESGREYVAQNGLANTIQLRLGDATALDFEPGAFTKVLAIECAFHFDTREEFFREAARVLAPGGRMALTDVIPRRGIERADYLNRLPPVCSDVNLDVAPNAYDADVYARLLQQAGFDAISIEPITDLTMPRFADYLERLGNEIGGDKGKSLLYIAERHRAHVAAGADYVLVAARRSDRTA